jgi:GNAT superfamily N-acetyltransferase
MELSAVSEFRTAGPADVSAIVALVNDAYVVEASFIQGPRTNEKEIAGLLETGGFLLAEGPDGLEGCIYVETRGTVGYFGLLSVATVRQGRGLGRRLIAAAEAGLRGARCQIVEILVVNLRQELFTFYAALGYGTSGAAPFPESEKPRLVRPCYFVVMRKVLEAPSSAGERSRR